jgi:hypothetical protein
MNYLRVTNRNEGYDEVRTVEDVLLFTTKCGSGFCPMVGFGMNNAKLSGSIRGI